MVKQIRMREGMRRFYCTFGYNSNLRNCYVVVLASDSQAAHEKMYEQYGSNWSMCYPEEKYEECINRYGLERVAFGTTGQ